MKRRKKKRESVVDTKIIEAKWLLHFPVRLFKLIIHKEVVIVVKAKVEVVGQFLLST